MKFKVYMKTPDAIFDALAEAKVELGTDLHKECYTLAANFIKYGEIAVIEFDTETGTAVLCKT